MIGNVLLEPVLVSSMSSLTDTVMMDISTNGQQLLNRLVFRCRSLRGQSDDRLIGDSTGALTFASSGNAPGDAMHDLRTMMLAITSSIDTDPKYFFVASPDTAAKAATLSNGGVPAAAAGLLDVRLSDQADAEMSSTPAHNSSTPTPTQLVSAWQTNSVYVRGVMPVAAQVLHEPAISRLTGVDWGA